MTSSSRRKRRTTAWSSVLLFAFAAAAAPAHGQSALPGTKPWTNVPPDLAAWQFRELEAWYEARYRLPPGGPAPTREDWVKLIAAADYTFLEPRAAEEPLGESAALVTWPLMQVGSSPSTRGNAVARVPLAGVFHRAAAAGTARRPAVISLDERFIAADPGTHTLRLIAARREPFAQPWLDDRQWLDRLATQSGHTLLGAEVAQVGAVAKYLASRDDVDPDRISFAGGHEAVAAAAALGPRVKLASPPPVAQSLWSMPQDLSIWSQAARRLDWTALASLAALSPAPMRPAPPLDERRLARAYNAVFTGWQAWFHNRLLESYAARDRRPPTMEDYLDITGRYPAPQPPGVSTFHGWVERRRPALGFSQGDSPELKLGPPAAAPPSAAPEAESVPVYDTPEVRGYRLKVKVYEDVHATGILLIPKSLDPARRHPMVFVQHGLAGRPEDALGVEKAAGDAVYRAFGLQLARRGYLVFAPMISTQTVIGRNELVRRARPLGLGVMGMERAKFSRLLDFFATLPMVDAARIGFYGLSYGGYTALWTTPGEPRFRAVVCSGHFNDWSPKTTGLTMGSSYMFYADHLDMYNHGLLARFGHAGLAQLIRPRPLLIEMGSEDGVMAAPRRLVDDEIARSGAEVARFEGGHRIDGAKAFAFLDRHLAKRN